MKQTLSLAILVSAVIGLAACTDEKRKPAPKAAESPQSVVAPAFDSAAAEEAMKRPLDGSSVEAFEQDLEKVQAVVKPEDFKKVQSALEWMLFYDFSVGGSKAKLYASLDGASPLEVIEKAGRKQGQ